MFPESMFTKEKMAPQREGSTHVKDGGSRQEGRMEGTGMRKSRASGKVHAIPPKNKVPLRCERRNPSRA